MVRHERLGANFASRHIAAQLLAARAQILDFAALFRRAVERRVGQLIVVNGNTKRRWEFGEFVFIEFFLVVSNISALTAFAQAIALNRARKNNGGRTRMLHGRLVRGINFSRIVAALPQRPQSLIRNILDHFQQAWVGAKNILPNIRTRFDDKFLRFAVDHFSQPLGEQAVDILFEERIPIASPKDFDDVPACAPEGCFEFLHDLPVATNRAVQTLQVAVDNKNQVVQVFARSEGDSAKRFWFVGLTVAQKRPDFGVRLRLDAAIFEIAIEAGLVNGHQRAEAHGYRGVFPEVGHQPGMRIRRKAAVRPQLPTKVFQLLCGKASLEKGAGVNAGRGMPLKVNSVALKLFGTSTEEMIEADLKEGSGGRIRGNMAANAVVDSIGANDHGQRVPADQALDPAFDLLVAGKNSLLFHGDRIYVGSVRGERRSDTQRQRTLAETVEQKRCGFRALLF